MYWNLKMSNVFIGPFNHLAKKISRILKRTEVSSTCKTFSFTFFNLYLLILHTSHLICKIDNSVQDTFKRNKFSCGWTWLTWSNTLGQPHATTIRASHPTPPVISLNLRYWWIAQTFLVFVLPTIFSDTQGTCYLKSLRDNSLQIFFFLQLNFGFCSRMFIHRLWTAIVSLIRFAFLSKLDD